MASPFPWAETQHTIPTATPATSQTHPYTIIFTTPKCAVPTFLHDLQQSPTLNPLFIGEDGCFFRKRSPTIRGWSHILLFSGANISLPEEWSIRQRWSFNILADRNFTPEEKSTPGKDMSSEEAWDWWRSQDPQITSTQEVQNQNSEKLPEDLENAVKYSVWRGGLDANAAKKKRVYVLTFVAFDKEQQHSRQIYEQHISSLRHGHAHQGGRGGKSTRNQDIQIHISGPVTSSSQIECFATKQTHDPDPMDYFTLMSFGSLPDYAAYLASEEYGRLEGEGVKLSMVVTSSFLMPGKEQVIDKFGWQYGNPWEPWGDDWFG